MASFHDVNAIIIPVLQCPIIPASLQQDVNLWFFLAYHSEVILDINDVIFYFNLYNYTRGVFKKIVQ